MSSQGRPLLRITAGLCVCFDRVLKVFVNNNNFKKGK